MKMRIGNIEKSFILLVFIVCNFLVTSCRSVNQLRYFKNLPDSSVVHLPHVDQELRLVQKGDKLMITIGAKNPEAAAIFNNYGEEPTSGSKGRIGGGGAGANASDLAGFWVDELGEIEFPVVGKVKAEGYTASQLKDVITEKVSPYLREPLVNVKFISFKFTVLGEVRSPGVYALSHQRTTLLDALGVAGDLPRSAKRYDIQLYRDYNGVRTISKLDLRKKELLNNPELFYVKHNDVIIVQPRDMRLFSDEARAYIGLLTLLMGASALLITVINNK